MSSSSARALRILDEIARSDHPLNVTEIARALALPPGTVFRSMDALLRTGLAARYQASARYVTGPAAGRLQRSVIARFAAREICLPWLRQLASISAETVSLHVRAGWNEARICSVPGTGEVMTLPPLGEMHPLGESCAGHAILAFLPEAEISAYFANHGTAAQTCHPRRAERSEARDRGREEIAGGDFSPSDASARRLPRAETLLRRGRAADGFPSPRAASQPSAGNDTFEQPRLNLWRDLARIASRGFATASGEHGTIAFPVRKPAAAITIEAPFAASATSVQISDCRRIIGNIEALASAQPSLFANPFAHL